jgi:uncharacterized membrane protein YhaH (DUF805 family)
MTNEIGSPPPGWERRIDKDGHPHFVRSSHHVAPLVLSSSTAAPYIAPSTSHSTSQDDSFHAWVLLAVILMIYFLPALIASHRRHRNRTAIGMTNLLLGWTAIGWIIAIIWASTADTESKT